MAPSPSDNLPPDQLFLKSLPLIDKLIAFACRRSRFSQQDAEDFASCVKIKLIEDDYGVLRKFEGRCKLHTFLGVTIQNLAKDYRDHIWRKHRASAEAKRLGEVAERLEMLLVRDGYTFDEACQILRINQKVDMSVAELADLRAKLPPRTGWHKVGEEGLQGEAAQDPRPDQELQEKEREVKLRRVLMGVHRALSTLSKDDQLLVKKRTRFSVAEIARIDKVEQKPLYRRLEKIYKALEKALEREGVRREDVKEILACLRPDLYAQPKKKG
jgi:RNA polymerase sigma factor (sigma-70 family)